MEDASVTFERLTDIGADAPVLIEGFPGFGLVAAIAVDQITTQLGLEHHGNLVSEAFPPVLSHRDGRARDMIRVYGDADHDVMTLQSDVTLPPHAFSALSQCVYEDLAAEFDRAIFLAGAPARNEDELGEIEAIATTDTMEAELRSHGIELADGAGLVGGIMGALATDCYHYDVPAAVLVVRADPYIPDPGAARSVIENGLEPLVSFDIDTTELAEQSNQIQQQMQQIAEQYRQMLEADSPDQQVDTAMMGIQ